MSENFVIINGQRKAVRDQELGFSLLTWLRETAGLTGAKCGCGAGQCGSCNVLINGKVRRSCLFSMEKLIGAEILTVEGLARGNRLHPVQESFIVCGVAQCGFCTPSQIIAAVGLLQENPSPTRADIDKAFKGVYCRCGSYPRVIKAIGRAAAILRGEDWQEEDPEFARRARDLAGGRPLEEEGQVLGRSYPMPDAVDKVTGRAKFVDDYAFEGMLFGKIVLAPIPCGYLEELDISQAENAPGVRYILSYKNAREFRYGPITRDTPVLCDRHIRYHGQPIAAVFAETQEEADGAALLIRASCKETPGVFTPEEALAEGAPLVHPTGNITSRTAIEKGDIDQAFKEAAVIVEAEYYSQRIEHAYIEPETAVAVPRADGGLDVYHMTQAPFSARDSIARYFDLPPEKVNSIQVTLGGSFGGKGDDMTRLLCCAAAMATGRPVKLRLSRRDSLLYHYKRHPYTMNYKVGATKEGKLLAMDIRLLSDGGAYSFHSHRVMGHSVCYATGPYYVPNLRTEGVVAFTNNAPAGAMRGYGVVQTSLASEGIMDELARALDMDPIELRRINALGPGLPMPAGQILGPGHHFREALDIAEQKIRERLLPLKEQHPHVGIGFASTWRYVGGGLGPDEEVYADLELLPDGLLYLRTSISEMGNESQVAMAQLAADELGLPCSALRVAPITTLQVPWGGSVMASRGTFLWGQGVLDAARKMKELLLCSAARLWPLVEDIRFEGGEFLTPGGQVLGNLRDLARQASRENAPLFVHGAYRAPQTYFPLEDCNAGRAVPEGEYRTHHTSSYCCLGVAIQAAPGEKKVRVLNMVAALDIGKVINPEAARRQIEGGFIMGQGMALSEEVVIENGVNQLDAFSKCRLVDLAGTPDMDITLLEAYDPTGPRGAKGVGEISVPAVMPAILNAYFDATGRRIRRLPLQKQL